MFSTNLNLWLTLPIILTVVGLLFSWYRISYIKHRDIEKNRVDVKKLQPKIQGVSGGLGSDGNKFRIDLNLLNYGLSPAINVKVWMDDNGNRIPSGIYFYRLDAGDNRETRKMVLVK